ncbi:hypothetical protein BAC1_00624 [uncultured bacterium]|nr:hypothetical protein BAC1_00624 [uncultured bacterium]
MIIQCDKCATKFRLDDSRITPNGVKVRCTKCDNVFIVTPPPSPEEVQVEELFGMAPGMEERATAGAAEGLQPKSQSPKPKADDRHLAFDFGSEETREDIFKTAEKDFSQEDGEPEAGQGFSTDNSGEGKKFSLDDLDFSFSEDRTDKKKEEEDGWGTSPEDEEDDPFSGAFDKPLSSEEEDTEGTDAAFDGAAEKSVEKGELDFSFGDLTADDPKPDAAPPTDELEDEESEPEPEAQNPPVAENVIPFSAAAAYSKEGKAPAVKTGGEQEEKEEEEAFKTFLTRAEKEEVVSFGDPDEKEEDEEYEEEDSGPAQRSQPRMGLIIAALVIVLGGGLIYFTGVIDRLTHILMPSGAEVSVVEIEAIKGFYEENKNFGKLFVIDARIKNITDSPQEIKAATGVIYNDSGDKIAEKSVSPGRLVSIEDVRNLQKEELERAFRDPSGGIIPPKGSVPVMVLFTETPEGLSEFGLDIVK